MNQFEITVTNADSRGLAPCCRPVFAWKCACPPEAGGREYDQYTVQVAADEEFRRLLFLRDTCRSYIEFDSAPLHKNKIYFIRVRSGLGKWSEGSFMTGNH